MSKKSRKERKKKSIKPPKISPLTMLRPRLDGLFGNEDLAQRDDAWIGRDLDAVLRDLTPNDFLPTLLKAYHSAPPIIQERLTDVVPHWLAERDHTPTLINLFTQGRFDLDDQPLVEQWLQAQSIDLTTLKAELKKDISFCEAHLYEDEFGSQGNLIILWYIDSQQRKVHGFSFLIDYNPPWEGAIKNVIILPKGSLDVVKRKVVDAWQESLGVQMEKISGKAAKEKLLTCLQVNYQENIRLPKDLTAIRDMFWKYFPALPDIPEIPDFTPKEFDYLSQNGQSPEHINHFERTVGRRIRLEDGKEIFMAGVDDWEE